MRPLTDTTPKPLLRLCGKTIIEHNIEPIIHLFEEIFIVVKYKKEIFQVYFGEEFLWKKINYIEQIDIPGTGAAILSLKDKISWDFIVVSGDDLYDPNDITKITHHNGLATLCKRVANPEDFWIFQVDATGKTIRLIEKPTNKIFWDLANIGIHKFHSDIFADLEKIALSPRWELEITDLIDSYIQEGKYSVVEATGRWITIGYPWDLLRAGDEIVGAYESITNRGAIIEENVHINGNAFLEEGVIIKSGTYIEWNVFIGKWAIIGPNAYIRWNSIIGAESKIGAFVEFKNSYIGQKSSVPHLSYIGDSIIGNHVNLGGGTKVANLRHDWKTIKAISKWKLLDTGRRKLWAIIGDWVHTAINTLIYPGRTLETNSTTLPGEIIR